MGKRYTFEICANSVESCVAAQQGGADRVELCAAIPEGGTTPSYGEMTVARRMLDIRLHAIIRPRGGDFLYTPIEADAMLADIRAARAVGADGVVVGCLTPDGDLDLPLLQRLLDEAKGMSVTFHRAFDRCRQPLQALDQPPRVPTCCASWWPVPMGASPSWPAVESMRPISALWPRPRA